MCLLGSNILNASHLQRFWLRCLYLQTHEVISDAGKSDADKRLKLLNLYNRTERFLGQFEEDFLEILQKSVGDLKTSLEESKQRVEPSDKYVVLVAGLFPFRC